LLSLLTDLDVGVHAEGEEKIIWAASKGKVPTVIMLKRRDLNLASTCAMCLIEEESVDRLFVHC